MSKKPNQPFHCPVCSHACKYGRKKMNEDDVIFDKWDDEDSGDDEIELVKETTSSFAKFDAVTVCCV